MSEQQDGLNRRNFLKAAASAGITTGIAGCSEEEGPSAQTQEQEIDINQSPTQRDTTETTTDRNTTVTDNSNSQGDLSAPIENKFSVIPRQVYFDKEIVSEENIEKHHLEDMNELRYKNVEEVVDSSILPRSVKRVYEDETLIDDWAFPGWYGQDNLGIEADMVDVRSGMRDSKFNYDSNVEQRVIEADNGAELIEGENSHKGWRLLEQVIDGNKEYIHAVKDDELITAYGPEYPQNQLVSTENNWEHLKEAVDVEEGDATHYTQVNDAASAIVSEFDEDEHQELKVRPSRNEAREGGVPTYDKEAAKEGVLRTYDDSTLYETVLYVNDSGEIYERETEEIDLEDRLD